MDEKNNHCQYCNENISPITEKLQSNPSALRWEKYGLCCVSCTAPNSLINRRIDAYKSFNSVKETIIDDKLTIYIDSRDKSTNISKKDRQKSLSKITSAKWMVITGNAIVTIGIIASLALTYLDYLTIAWLGLLPVLSGVLLCRRGAWLSRNPHKKMMIQTQYIEDSQRINN